MLDISRLFIHFEKKFDVFLFLRQKYPCVFLGVKRSMIGMTWILRYSIFITAHTSNEIKRCLFLLVNEKFFVERKWQKKVVSYPPHEFAQLPIFILRYIRSEGEQQYLHPIFEARGRCLPWVRFKVVRNSSDGATQH